MYQERRSVIEGATVWASSSELAGTTRILPDGCMDLIWLNGSLVVSGPDLFARTSVSTGASLAIGLRLPPGLAPIVFGVAAHELLGTVTELASLIGDRRTQSVEERIHLAITARDLPTAPAGTLPVGTATGTVPAGTVPAGTVPAGTMPSGTTRRPVRMSSLLEEEVRRLLSERTGSDAERVRELRSPELRIPEMLARGCSVAGIAAEIGYSPRQLQRRSLDAFGYGTKTLGAILRFQRAADLLHTEASLATIAAATGYADQSHLSRSVTRFAGVSPSRFVVGPSSIAPH